MALKHLKVSTKANPRDNIKVGGGNWNDDHVITDTATTGDVMTRANAVTQGYAFTPVVGIRGSRSVKDYGAKGDAFADDTAAFQACIDACMTTGAPATTTRVALHRMYVPPGDYKITAPLNIYSCNGFYLYGAGFQSIIRASGTFAQVLNLNGINGGIFRDLQVLGPFSTGQVTACIDLYWNGTTAQRSTTGCFFQNIFLGGRFIYGFGVSRLSNGGVQCDSIRFYSVIIRGTSATDGTLWQSGWYWGSGTAGNQTNYEVYATAIGQCKYGHVFDGVASLVITGSTYAVLDTCFFAINVFGYCHIKGAEVEHCLRFWDFPSTASGPNDVIIEGVRIDSASLHTDGIWIRHSRPGSLILRDIRQQNSVPVSWTSADEMKIVLQNGVGWLTCIIEGMQVFDSIDRFVDNATLVNDVVVTAFTELNRSTGAVLNHVSGPCHIGPNATDIGYRARVENDPYDRVAVQTNGHVLFGSGAVATDTEIFRGGVGFMAVPIMVKAGLPADSDYASTPPNGTMAINSSNDGLYYRKAGTWTPFV